MFPSNLKNISNEELDNIISRSKDAYYNTDKPLITDDEFDKLVDELTLRGKQICVGSLPKKGKIQLPYPLFSMDKIKTEKEVTSWILNKSGPFVITEKLDGCSCIVLVGSEGNVKMYTRGNGFIGTDISYLYEQGYVQIPTTNSIVVRGELIIDIETFQNKYLKHFSNARNLVSGIVNSKNVNKVVEKNDLKFVAYEIITDNEKQERIEDQLKTLEKLKFDVVSNCNISNVNLSWLQSKLLDRKEKSIFEIDGLILTSNVKYERLNTGNPTISVAFKMDIEKAETTVLNVSWTESKWLKLKPVVKFEPVIVSGVTLSSASGYNARFIESNGIGPGSKIEIIRSGEVIPKIVNVITKGLYVDFPDFPYEWLEGNVDIVTRKQNEEINPKLLYGFFSKLGVLNVGLETVKKIMLVLKTKTLIENILEILNISIEKLLTVNTIQLKSATRIKSSIDQILKSKFTLVEFLVASSSFGEGFSSKKIEKLFVEIPNLLDLEVSNDLKNQISLIEGFSCTSAEKILKHLKTIKTFKNLFLPFIRNNDVLIKNEIVQDQRIEVVLFTGGKNKILEEKFRLKNWIIEESFSKKVTLLIDKEETIKSLKRIKAEKNGIKIMSWDEAFALK